MSDIEGWAEGTNGVASSTVDEARPSTRRDDGQNEHGHAIAGDGDSTTEAELQARIEELEATRR